MSGIPQFKIDKLTGYLDTYKNNDKLTREEYLHFLKVSRHDYLKFTELNNQIKKHNRNSRVLKDPNSYNYYMTSFNLVNPENNNDALYNTIYNNEKTFNSMFRNIYDLSLYDSTCLNSNTAFLFKNPTSKSLQSPIVKTPVYLTIKRSLAGLIDIINETPYSELCDYNIDLKMLNNIKCELTELNNMIGMDSLKETIFYQIMYFIQSLHIGGESDYKHTVIYGPPGTGKTEIAKIIGRLYSKMGILKNGIFKKVSRNDLVAGYLGQTAIKTKQVITECLGGCLFIDEVYSLSTPDKNQDIFSKECIDILCEALSEHRDDLMVIIAGYEEEIKNCFFKANDGLESRFIWRFKINKYTANELMRIFIKKSHKNDWVLVCDEHELEEWFKTNFDYFKYYGRDAELLFTFVKIAHSTRIYGLLPEHKKNITMEDVMCGFELFKKQKPDDQNDKYMKDYIKNTMYS